MDFFQLLSKCLIFILITKLIIILDVLKQNRQYIFPKIQLQIITIVKRKQSSFYSLSISSKAWVNWIIIERFLLLKIIGRGWQLVRSLLSNHKVPSSILALPRFEYLCDLLFCLSQLSFPSFSICWELTCDGLVSHPRDVNESHPLSVVKTLQKPEISAGSMGHSARKGFSLAKLSKIVVEKSFKKFSLWHKNYLMKVLLCLTIHII